VGVVIDGLPARLRIDQDHIQEQLDRRRPGQSRLTTQRDEKDLVEILSGVESGASTGAPLAMLVRNSDARSGAYDHLRELYRPSHADFTYDAKYGNRSIAGGGRSSARETIGRVAAGAVAMQLLDALAQRRDSQPPQIVSWVQGGISNGEDVTFRTAFKPTATISSEQDTVTVSNEATTLAAKGRHDPCVLPRAVPMVDAMAALVLADHTLRQLRNDVL